MMIKGAGALPAPPVTELDYILKGDVELWQQVIPTPPSI